MSTDLASRIAETTAFINAQLSEDEAWAKVALEIDGTGEWRPGPYYSVVDSDKMHVLQANDGATAIHAARQDPARALRRVGATRDLVADILAERHDYMDGDPFFSCSQATVPGEDGEPGSGCANDERAGKPCDCGRDARVARMLGIIASEWEDGS